MAPSLASALVLSATSAVCKSWVGLGTKGMTVNGLPILMEALRERGSAVGRSLKGKEKALDQDAAGGSEVYDGRRGIVTICNHNSVMDDPVMWTLMPYSNYLPFSSPSHVSRYTRWTLGASDVMFTKPWHAKFFTLGQVIETYRGAGIFQPAVDDAIKLLQKGEWIHIFPEGKVNQEKNNPEGGILRFKWGVGRVIMDSEVMPEIIPIWISGWDGMMNEHRGWPRPLPRPGAKLSVTIGEPITNRVKPLRDVWREMASHEKGKLGLGGEWGREAAAGAEGTGGGEPGAFEQRVIRGEGRLADGKERDVRIKICEVLQDSLKELGQKVERDEGRFERGEWSQSTSWEERGGKPSGSEK